MIDAISCEQVVFSYFEESKPILDEVSLKIPAGSITVIMGSSGCGKSTLAAVMCGLFPENGGFLRGGEVTIFGKPLAELTPAVRAREISMMFQNPDLQFCMPTLREELYFCMENILVAPEEMKALAENAANEMGTGALLDRPLHSLSGGEKQRAVLTCIRLLDAKCILLDEPFANLDPDAVKELMGTLAALAKEQGKTIVAIDHMSDHWIGTADRFLLLEKGGRVVCEATTEEELDAARELFQKEGVAYPGIWKELGEAVENGNTAGNRGIELKELVVPKVPVKPVKRGLFGRKTAAKVSCGREDALYYQADAVIPEGKIVALMGSSGCGKTSFFMTLLKQRAYGGQILVKEEQVRELSDIDVKQCFTEVGIAFQNPANQFVTQNVTEEVEDGLKRRFPGDSPEEIRKKALELLDTCGLRSFQKFSPYMLSQGQQRRLAVLAVLAAGQKLLLLDEPTYGQDFRCAKALMDLVKKKVLEEGLTVIMSTHDPGIAGAYADVILRVKDKKIVQDDAAAAQNKMQAEAATAQGEIREVLR